MDTARLVRSYSQDRIVFIVSLTLLTLSVGFEPEAKVLPWVKSVVKAMSVVVVAVT